MKRRQTFSLHVLTWTLLLIFCRQTATLADNKDDTYFKCPRNETIAPCFCRFNEFSNGWEVECGGPRVTSDVLAHLVETLWLINSPREILQFHKLTISQSALETLELAPFYGLKLTQFYIFGNDNLTRIVTHRIQSRRSRSKSKSSSRLIMATQLYLGLNPLLTDEGLGYFLQSFDPISMTALTISGSKIEGSKFSPDFLPGLSAFTQLATLSLGSCGIATIGGGQFRKNVMLKELFLGFNSIKEIGEGAFIFDDPPSSFLKERLSIYLNYNQISEKKFSGATSGLDRSPRPIFLSMEFNEFEFLNETDFRPFLLAHPTNQIELLKNPLICDGRMQWLKTAPEVFQYLVLAAFCGNDPGKTVWDSDLIP